MLSGNSVDAIYNLQKDSLIEKAEQEGANEVECQCQKRKLDFIRSEVVGLGGDLGPSSTEQDILISYL